VDPGQSTFVRHSTQASVAGSQIGLPLPQLPFVRHCTQYPPEALQYGVFPPHCPDPEHPVTHRCVAVSQTRPPSPQSAVVRHWTHTSADVSQRGRRALVQLVSVVHCTHSIVEVLQAGVPPPACMHCVLFVQDMTHRLVAWLQTTPPPPQLAVVRHCTHAPAGEQ
jgi:hypothetical protein